MGIRIPFWQKRVRGSRGTGHGRIALCGPNAPVWAGMGLRLYRVPPGMLAYNDVGGDAPPVIERTGIKVD